MKPARRRLSGGRAAAFLALAALFSAAPFMTLRPAVTRALSRMLRVPVRAEGVRWIGFGDIAVERASIGSGDAAKTVEGLRLYGLSAALFGSPVRIAIGRLRIGEEDFGHARGRFLWHAGRLEKAHGLVTLTGSGLQRVPGKWRKRLFSTPEGPAFLLAYASGKIALRGKNGPILEAAWQPG